MVKNPKAKAFSNKKRNKPFESTADLEAKLTPEAKALLEESREIRRKVGPVPFKVRDLIREIRE
jgi:hypothetical protein